LNSPSKGNINNFNYVLYLTNNGMVNTESIIGSTKQKILLPSFKHWSTKEWLPIGAEGTAICLLGLLGGRETEVSCLMYSMMYKEVR
jgi:hypothetical protein